MKKNIINISKGSYGEYEIIKLYISIIVYRCHNLIKLVKGAVALNN